MKKFKILFSLIVLLGVFYFTNVTAMEKIPTESSENKSLVKYDEQKEEKQKKKQNKIYIGSEKKRNITIKKPVINNQNDNKRYLSRKDNVENLKIYEKNLNAKKKVYINLEYDPFKRYPSEYFIEDYPAIEADLDNKRIIFDLSEEKDSLYKNEYKNYIEDIKKYLKKVDFKSMFNYNKDCFLHLLQCQKESLLKKAEEMFNPLIGSSLCCERGILKRENEFFEKYLQKAKEFELLSKLIKGSEVSFNYDDWYYFAKRNKLNGKFMITFEEPRNLEKKFKKNLEECEEIITMKNSEKKLKKNLKEYREIMNNKKIKENSIKNLEEKLEKNLEEYEEIITMKISEEELKKNLEEYKEIMNNKKIKENNIKNLEEYKAIINGKNFGECPSLKYMRAFFQAGVAEYFYGNKEKQQLADKEYLVKVEPYLTINSYVKNSVDSDLNIKNLEQDVRLKLNSGDEEIKKVKFNKTDKDFDIFYRIVYEILLNRKYKYYMFLEELFAPENVEYVKLIEGDRGVVFKFKNNEEVGKFYYELLDFDKFINREVFNNPNRKDQIGIIVLLYKKFYKEKQYKKIDEINEIVRKEEKTRKENEAEKQREIAVEQPILREKYKVKDEKEENKKEENADIYKAMEERWINYNNSVNIEKNKKEENVKVEENKEKEYKGGRNNENLDETDTSSSKKK